ncbi:MAG: hypothetical protein ABSC55_23055 [Syntrophorhabdales bacterium]
MMRSLSIIGAFMVLLGVLAVNARAQEVWALGGVRQNFETHADTYIWQLEYMQGLSDHIAWSFSYLNEGHVPNHQRDGAVSQLWARTDVLQQRLSLAAGIGAYRYFDTTAPTDESYANNHGWAAIFTLAATWHVQGPWLMQLRGNWVHAERGVDNLSAFVGIGYQLDTPPAFKEQCLPEKLTNNEITLFFGQEISNNFNSDKSIAASIEYRRRLAPFLEWTVSSVYEGDNGIQNRTGLMTQLWAVRSFLDERFTLGIGGGPYFVVDTHHAGDDETVVGVFSMTASYRFMPRWAVRLSWNRVVTNYDSDSDVILAGLGYLF